MEHSLFTVVPKMKIQMKAKNISLFFLKGKSVQNNEPLLQIVMLPVCPQLYESDKWKTSLLRHISTIFQGRKHCFPSCQYCLESGDVSDEVFKKKSEILTFFQTRKSEIIFQTPKLRRNFFPLKHFLKKTTHRRKMSRRED